jgi:hypothetical protein
VSLVLPAELGGTGDKLVIQPKDQLDGTLTIRTPVIDLAAWKRVSAANASAEASSASRLATEQDVETQVYRSYYPLVGQEAVLEAAQRTLEVAHKNLEPRRCERVTRRLEVLDRAAELHVERTPGRCTPRNTMKPKPCAIDGSIRLGSSTRALYRPPAVDR